MLAHVLAHVFAHVSANGFVAPQHLCQWHFHYYVGHQVKILNRHLREVVREYIIIDTKNQIDFDEFIIYNGLLVSYKSCLK